MQDSSLSIPQWLLVALRDIAMVLGGGVIVRLITLYQNRKKPFVEVKKAEAETTEITIRSKAAAGDSMIRMLNRLEEASANLDRLRSERDDWRFRAEQAENQQKIDEYFISRLKAANDLGIKLSDLPPKEKE